MTGETTDRRDDDARTEDRWARDPGGADASNHRARTGEGDSDTAREAAEGDRRAGPPAEDPSNRSHREDVGQAGQSARDVRDMAAADQAARELYALAKANAAREWAERPQGLAGGRVDAPPPRAIPADSTSERRR